MVNINITHLVNVNMKHILLQVPTRNANLGSEGKTTISRTMFNLIVKKINNLNERSKLLEMCKTSFGKGIAQI